MSALVITWLMALGGQPEDSWITMYLMIYWAIALCAYVAYCAVAFALATRWSRHS